VLDLSSFKNGQFGLLGDFDSISNYSYTGVSNFTNQNALKNQLYYTTGHNEKFITFGEVDGTVDSILSFTKNSFLLVGDFKSIGNTRVSSPAIYNASSNEFRVLDSNSTLSGEIIASLYNQDENVVYLGGDFTFNNTQSAALYNLTSNELQSTLFQGFGENSSVKSIIQVGSSIVFGGTFDTLGLPELLSAFYNSSNIAIESDQLVSLRFASFSSSDDSSTPDVLACPNGEEWSVPGTSGTLNIDLPFEVIPSKIRIYNSAQLDSQVSLFRLITAPANGIMNLTYIDPSTGELAYCDAWCPLLSSTELKESVANMTELDLNKVFGDTTVGFESTYQEFGFVNSLDVSHLVFQALDSFGNAVALAGFEIFQNLFPTYANNTLNEPSCGSTSNYSSSDLIGNWSASAFGSYLQTNVVASGDLPEVGVIFHPNITYAGNYSILLYTPGCSADSTCDTRGIANVTVFDDVTNEVLETQLIYQTNLDEKYDSIFSGHLLHPVRVQMMLYSKVLDGSDSSITLVADRITTTIFSTDQLSDMNGSIAINGIFEYSPLNFTNFNSANLSESVLVGNTTLNSLGRNISEAAIVQLALLNDTIYIAGDFKSDFGDNLFQLKITEDNSGFNSTTGEVSALDGGLNGAISLLEVVGDSIILLGEFNDTINSTNIHFLSSDYKSMNGSALYNGSWISFGSNVGTKLTNLTLQSREYWVFENETWDMDTSSWFQSSSLLSFNATSSSKSGNDTLFVGSLRISDAIGDKAIFVNSSFDNFNITDDNFTSGVLKVGVFINDSLSAFGGEFATASDLSNLILVSGNDTSGLDINWDQNSTVTALFALQEKLFIGTSGSGTVHGDDFDGVLIYNLNNDTFQSVGTLSDSNGDVQVNGFGYFNDTYLVVGGNFDSAESAGCSGFCFYNMNETSWVQLLDHFSGTVNSFRFINNTLVAGGNFTFEEKSLNLFTYDFSSNKNEQPSHFTDIRSTVQRFILVDNSTSGRMIISGESFISAYNGSSWTDITGELEGSLINDIALLDLSESNESNNGSFFNSSQILVASGNLNVGSYGYVSVAFFNSTTWLPYLITTEGDSYATVNSIFMNKDISSLFVSGSISNTTHTSPTTTSTASSSSSTSGKHQKSGKMDRGFIVLVGLACAVGTMGLLGAAGAFLLFTKRDHDYTPLEPRVNETEMLDTVPPENLLKHV
jgi:hypothetical protein